MNIIIPLLMLLIPLGIIGTIDHLGRGNYLTAFVYMLVVFTLCFI